LWIMFIDTVDYLMISYQIEDHNLFPNSKILL
jgi:hypothetical protein